MHLQARTRVFISTVRPAALPQKQLRFAIAALALLTCAVAHAQLPVQQVTVAFTNSFPNASIDTLTMPNSAAAIMKVNPLLTNGSPDFANVYTALVWVTNPATNTLDVIYADAEQRKIWRLPGPSYTSPVAIFSWSRNVPGPACPVGLAADPNANVYVISAGCLWGKASVWVLPVDAAGGYGTPPLLIDNTFTDPATHKPVPTLALTEVLVAGSAATGVAPAWGAGDLLVVVADLWNTRVIDYSPAQIASVLSTAKPLLGAVPGPASTVVTRAQFSTQALTVNKFKIPPVPIGMDIAQDPNTQDMTLLLPTADGRILDFDSAPNKNAFITPYAIQLGLGLTRLKVVTFQKNSYAIVGQLPGRILEFAAPGSGVPGAPLAGSSNTLATLFASVSTGVNNPAGLAVTYSASAAAGSCVGGASFTGSITNTVLTVTAFASGPPIAVGQTITGSGITPGTMITSLGNGTGGPGTYNVSAASNVGSEAMMNAGCAITPQFALEFTGSGTGNIDPTAPIVVDGCTFIDDRVTFAGQCPVATTLDLGAKCPNMPHVLLPTNICGAWGGNGEGSIGASINAAKIGALKVNQKINNTFTSFLLNPSLVLPGSNPQCGDPNGPIAAYAPLPGVESPIPEGNTVIDITVACTPDPPPKGGGNHASVLLQGTVNAALTAGYIAGDDSQPGEYGNLQTAFTNITTGPAPAPGGAPPATQIVDPTNTVVSTIQGFITNSLNYFNQANYNCALNTLWQGVQYVNTLANTPTTSPQPNSGDFIGAPVAAPPLDQNPSGTLLMRLDHLYYDVYIFGGIATTGHSPPALTIDALNLPAASVPACVSLNGPAGLAFNPANGNLYVANYNNGKVLVYAPTGPGGQMAVQPNLTLGGFTNPVSLAFAPVNESSNISGWLLVADKGRNTVTGWCLYMGNLIQCDSGEFTKPTSVAADSRGNIYVAETNDIRVAFAGEGIDTAYTYTADANELSFAGVGALDYNGTDLLVGRSNRVDYYTTASLSSPSLSCSGPCPPPPDGGQVPDTPNLNSVSGIGLDRNGNVDVINHNSPPPPSFVQFVPITGVATALTLSGGPALSNPESVVVDASGNIYVSSFGNNTINVYTSTGAYSYTIH